MIHVTLDQGELCCRRDTRAAIAGDGPQAHPDVTPAALSTAKPARPSRQTALDRTGADDWPTDPPFDEEN